MPSSKIDNLQTELKNKENTTYLFEQIQGESLDSYSSF